LALDQKFLKPKIPLLELLIKCQKRTYGFWHLIETFDQLKKETFDQLKFSLTTLCQLKQYYKKIDAKVN
jgi:hypothetical protein